MSSNQELISKLKEAEIVTREQVTLRSGETSDFYCDVRKLFGYPEILNFVCDELFKKLPVGTSCIAASGYGGLPLAAVVASRNNLKLCGVRSSSKDHGKSGLIAGYVPTKEDVVVIIDDVLTSGSSVKETVAGLATIDIVPKCVYVVVNRGNPDLGIDYGYLVIMQELID